MENPKTPFKWEGTTHSLEGVSILRKEIIALTVRKDGFKPQELTLDLPRDVTVEIVHSAWEAQGNQWIELYVNPGVNFRAKRVIWLPTGVIIWEVWHLHNRPSDSLAFTDLTREEWMQLIA